jgi:phosphoribosylglycinamide formyltransferase-1
MTGNRRLGVLISGRGSNLQALIDAIAAGRLHAEIAVVISNLPDAPGLKRARAAGIETLVMPHRQWRERADYERALVEALQARRVELVCLAGFMRLLGPTFVEAFAQRILNVHPSLLPAFPGLEAQRQAFEYGVAIAGATVHFVTAELDAGPIVMQAAIPVESSDTPESLSARILHEEHRIYPEAVEFILHGRWRLKGRRLVRETPAAAE